MVAKKAVQKVAPKVSSWAARSADKRAAKKAAKMGQTTVAAKAELKAGETDPMMAV